MTFNQSDPAKYEETKDADTVVCTDPEAKAWAGWGTSLKPAHEPICMARKPMKHSIVKNVQVWHTGALNIDATRVPYESEEDKNSIDHKVPTAAWSGHTIAVDSYVKGAFEKVETNDLGRFPSNVLGEIKDYQKYFYCPKVSRNERHAGFDTSLIPTNPNGILDNKDENGNQVLAIDSKRLGTEKGNNHPTVKPIELMKYLIKLVTPPGGTVLDPFNGSGSTGCAAVELGHEYVGIELDPAYVEIAKRRIEAWNKTSTAFEELFE
jgi:site-specific DNA-methyltransferase (adenine-specific)